MAVADDEKTSQPDQRHSLRLAVAAGVAAFMVPPVAWLLSLGLSYVIQDFTCTAAASADRPGPEEALLVILSVMNAALLVVTVLCGVTGLLLIRRRGSETGLLSFLAYSSIALALLFGFGIILIAINPFVLGVCS